MTNSIGEIRDADFLFVIGSNTSEAHPIIAMEMKQAVRRGATLVVADPRAVWMTTIAERHLQLQTGHGRLAAERDGARHHRRGPGGRGLHRRPTRRATRT